jgi:hypothetical protein
LDAKSIELQAEIDRLAAQLDVRTVPVGLLTNDGLNIYVGDDGWYHFTFYERGKVGFDRLGSLDDVLYWFCQGEVSNLAHTYVGDRAQAFQFEYDVLRRFKLGWAKRNVREAAAMFRRNRPNELHPEGISLLPDIGEAL